MTTLGRLIETPECVAEGADWLARKEPRFAEILPLCAPLPLRRTDDGFARLLWAIIGQQVSTASASAIWSRLEAAGLVTPEAVLAIPEPALRDLGLSRQKSAYAHALADAQVDYVGLRALSDRDVIARLTAIKGIGTWTAEVYAMFALGRADVFAAGDLALQESARLVFDLPERPTPRALAALAADWSPWRSVAARLLWAYYRVAKAREGIR